MNKTKRFKELLFLENFDLLSAEEKFELKEFRNKYPELVEILESESIENYNSIALSAQSPEPPPRIKQKILGKISKRRKRFSNEKDSVFSSFIHYLIAHPASYFTGAALIIIASVIYIQFNQVSEKQAQLVSLMQSNRIYAELAQTIYPDRYMLFDLQIESDGTPLQAKVFLTKDNSTGLFQSDAKLPANTKKDYQLWLVKDSQMINGGVIQVSEEDSVLYHPLKNLPIADLEQIEGLVITVEPKGGVDAPSGDQIIIGVQAAKEF